MRSFQQNTRPVRPGPPKAARAAGAVFSRLARATRYADPALLENWPTIAGADAAALGRPGRLFGGRDRTLELIARDGPAASELQMHADDLLAAVNRYLGPGAVARIAIRQRTIKAGPSASGGASPGADGALGAALSAFRAAVKAKDTEN